MQGFFSQIKIYYGDSTKKSREGIWFETYMRWGLHRIGLEDVGLVGRRNAITSVGDCSIWRRRRRRLLEHKRLRHIRSAHWYPSL